MMLPVMPVIVMGALATPLAAHCHAASLAQLPGLGLHTGRDLRHVGNNVGTKPHRVGRTCLSNGIACLGICAIRQAKRHGRHDGKTTGGFSKRQQGAAVRAFVKTIAQIPACAKVAKVRSRPSEPARAIFCRNRRLGE